MLLYQVKAYCSCSFNVFNIPLPLLSYCLDAGEHAGSWCIVDTYLLHLWFDVNSLMVKNCMLIDHFIHEMCQFLLSTKLIEYTYLCKLTLMQVGPYYILNL